MSRASNLAGFTTSLSTTKDLNVGVVTASSFVGNLTGNATSATTATTASGLSGTPNVTVNNITGSQINVSGVSTLGSFQVSSGIVTATTGIITYYGDGSKLTGVAAAGAGGASDITANLFF